MRVEGVHGARMAFEMTPDIHGRMHEFFDKRIGRHLCDRSSDARGVVLVLGTQLRQRVTDGGG